MNATNLRVENVGKVFESKRGVVNALDPVSFNLGVGETISVVGPSGCGKSTLLRAVSGLDLPTSGVTLYGNAEVDRPIVDSGYVFQKDLLLEWKNVTDNVLLPAVIRKLSGEALEAARVRASDLLRQLGLSDFESRFPWELSGGMRQRVAIARALLLNPSILFLDEPFSALDALTRDQMNVTLQEIALTGECSTVLITHSIPEAIFVADRVLVMSPRPGRILDVIEIDFNKPRSLDLRETKEFAEISGRVREQFELAGVYR